MDLELFALVALLQASPEHHLARGQVGTIISFPTPFTARVEFLDPTGEEYATAEFPEDQLLRLHYEPTH